MSIPPAEDPWEARERERARWRRGGVARPSPGGKEPSRKSGPASPEIYGDDSGFKADIVAWGLIATLAILLCSEVPRIAPVERETLARIGSGGILLLIGIAREFQDRLLTAARRGPNPIILLLFGWSIFEFFHAPFRGYATTELMRIFDGIGAYFLCAYCLRAPRQTGLMAAGILFLGTAVALLDLGHVGGGNSNITNWLVMDYSILGTHENVGSFLMLLFPIALAFAVSPEVEEKRRLSAIAASLIIGAGLLVARPRSAWIGSLFGLLVLAFLHFRYSNEAATTSEAGYKSTRRRPRLASLIGSPLILIAGAVVLFLVSAGVAPIVARQFSSIKGFKNDANFTARADLWAGAVRMASEEPVLGRGLGTFEVIEGRWTHSGTEIERALSSGVGDENMAHNYYVQWAADTGGVGLFLYSLTIVVFLWLAYRAIPRATSPLQRALLCGCIAAIAAGVVDALASPAYYFHGISTLYWCIMGLGVASMRPAGVRGNATSTDPEAAALVTTRLSEWLVTSVVAATVVMCVLGLGYGLRKKGSTVPRGRFELSLQPNVGPVYPGQTLRWTAFFHDVDGAERSTMPGTIWHLTSSDPKSLATPRSSIDEWSPVLWVCRHEAVTVVAPSMTGTLTMHARYSDNYGRWYDAYSMQDVRPRKSNPPSQ